MRNEKGKWLFIIAFIATFSSVDLKARNKERQV